MGMFDNAPAGAENVIDPGVDVETDAGAGAEPAFTPPEPPKTEHVPLPAKPSRRQAAAAAQQDVMKELNSFKEKFTSELSQRDQVIAELRGRLSATEPLVARAAQPQQPAGPPEETPDQLRAKAREHLDKGEVREYERLRDEATKREILAEVTKRMPQQPAQGPQQDPRLLVLMAQNPEVTQHPAGIQIATMEDGILAAQGVPNGPERWARAFQMAKARIAGQTPAATPQGFTTQAAGALAAVPTGQPAARATERGPGVELTDYEKNVARIAGMSLDEYARGIAERFPHRVVR